MDDFKPSTRNSGEWKRRFLTFLVFEVSWSTTSHTGIFTAISAELKMNCR
jgi:hypothetical protein